MSRRSCRWLWAAVIGVWLATALPLVVGQRTLYLRDVFASHLHLKAFGAASLERGEIPAFNPQWALGQPFRGNPNALPFYPGNVLYLLLPFWSAFNLHYLLHWLLALVAMERLARGLGRSPPAALLAGITYAGSGWILSCLSFYNLLTVSAWWPLAILGAVRGGRRGIGLGGAAAGMALLGGEPLLALLGVAALAVVAISRSGAFRGLRDTIAIGGLGLLVSLPQAVAAMRVLPSTVRADRIGGGPAGLFSLSPARLAELVLPLPFGWPTFEGELARVLVGPTYLFTLHAGVVALGLALLGARRHPGLAALAAAALGGALLGHWIPWLEVVTGGLVRYPEKLLFLLASSLPLLAAAGLDDVAADPRTPGRFRRTGATLGLVGLGLLLAGFLLSGTESPADHLRLAGFQALAGGLLLGAAGHCVRTERPSLVVGLQLLAVLQLAPLVATVDLEPLRRPPALSEGLAPGTAVVPLTIQSPFRDPVPHFALPDPALPSLPFLSHELLEPPTGVLAGRSYPLAPDLEGLYSPRSALLQNRLRALSPDQRVRWLRIVGADAVVGAIPRPPRGLVPIARGEILGAPVALLRVERPMPATWWPREIRLASDPEDAFRLTTDVAEPLETAVVEAAIPRGPEHRPGGRVHLVEAGADRLVLEVESDGGVAVVRRTWQPLLAATSGGTRLRIFPADLVLLGVEVPPGRRRVVLQVSSAPVAAAGAVAVLALLAAVGCFLLPEHPRTPSPPIAGGSRGPTGAREPAPT